MTSSSLQHNGCNRHRLLALCVLLLGLTLQGQESKQKQAPTPPGDSSPSSQKRLPPLQFDNNAVLHHLNQVISWYGQATTGVSSFGLPSDTIYQDNAKQVGAQVVKLAFQSAKTEAALIKNQQKVTDVTQPATTQAQTLAQMQVR